MEDNRYRRAAEQIKAPDRLKEETRALLRREIKKQRTRKWRPVLYGAAALAAALLLAVGLRPGMGPANPIRTELVAGEHVDTVELTDGTLHFTPLDQGTTLPIQLSPPHAVRQSVSLGEVAGLYPQSPLPKTPPQGFGEPVGGATAYSAQPGESPTGMTLRAVYTGERGELTLTASTYGMGKPASDFAGSMEGVSVQTGYQADKDIYCGWYATKGFEVQLEARGLSQEEFVLVLRYFILTE